MGKVSKDDKIKPLEAKVSLLEAEVLLKDELLDFMQAGIDELTEKVKELGEKAKYFGWRLHISVIRLMTGYCMRGRRRTLLRCFVILLVLTVRLGIWDFRFTIFL